MKVTCPAFKSVHLKVKNRSETGDSKSFLQMRLIIPVTGEAATTNARIKSPTKIKYANEQRLV